MTQALFAALVAAQKHVRALEKDGTNRGERFSYKYTTSETIIDEGRRVLCDHGLAFFETQAAFVGSNTNSPAITHCTYRLVHESGESVDTFFAGCPTIEGKGRPFDKVYAGARTTCLAYAIRGLLLIPRSDELAIEADSRDDSREEQPPEQRTDPPSRHGRDRDSEGPTDVDHMVRIAKEIPSRPHDLVFIEGEAERLGLSDLKRRILGMIAAAWGSSTEDAIISIVSKVPDLGIPRGAQIGGIDAAEWAKEEIKRPWRQMRERRASGASQ